MHSLPSVPPWSCNLCCCCGAHAHPAWMHACRRADLGRLVVAGHSRGGKVRVLRGARALRHRATPQLANPPTQPPLTRARVPPALLAARGAALCGRRCGRHPHPRRLPHRPCGQHEVGWLRVALQARMLTQSGHAPQACGGLCHTPHHRARRLLACTHTHTHAHTHTHTHTHAHTHTHTHARTQLHARECRVPVGVQGAGRCWQAIWPRGRGARRQQQPRGQQLATVPGRAGGRQLEHGAEGSGAHDVHAAAHHGGDLDPGPRVWRR
jgi:hypothetical protein